MCGWINVATFAVAVSYGYGRHADTLTPEQRSKAMLWSVAGYAPGLLSIGIPKPAVVALLTRILNPSRFHKWFLWSLAGVCVANIVGYIAIIFAQCQPASAQWNKAVEGVCWDRWVLVSYAIYSSGKCQDFGLLGRCCVANSRSFLCLCRPLSFYLPCCCPLETPDGHQEEGCAQCCTWVRINVRS